MALLRPQSGLEERRFRMGRPSGSDRSFAESAQAERSASSAQLAKEIVERASGLSASLSTRKSTMSRSTPPTRCCRSS